ncbi:bifunctional tetrahydrofolate synthase/dihydrofolate synthase [Accumulibacter sp.]|uniref:bifunctional tetrahydrofolate synthase/dihydrofolate synthase n=1 Tax=Accumulibacter sp. TaxID=2053492 RepID=UPI0026354F59|nr:bifunctional tetrahydrofolate synthase/dihydrofolate synthase [Accumulibacter sp.]
MAGWLEHLEKLHPRGQAGIQLGLERIQLVSRALAQRIGCPLIIVGGTNGKGSTCAYLEAIYSLAGYRVACYTSPHLLEYNERVRIDRQPVDDATLCDAFARVEAARLVTGAPLTYFEFGTLAAIEVFLAREVELIILEVGLGGRLDAVNAYDPDCAVITGIALDHTDWLGPTRAAIAFEKAGIYRAGKPAICADPDPPPALIERALAVGADLRLLGRDFGFFGDERQWTFWGRGGLRRGGLAYPALRGRGQLHNASAALATVEVLRTLLPVSMQAVRRGLIELQLAGRFQVLPGRPTVVLDVAHNPQAVASLVDNLDAMGFFSRTMAVVGMLADKDIAASLAPLAGKIDRWLLTDLEVVRGASADLLATFVTAFAPAGSVECFASPTLAFERSAKLAGENDRIVVFGSFYTVAAIMRNLQRGR